MMFVTIWMGLLYSAEAMSWAWRKLPCDILMTNSSVSLDCSERGLKNIPNHIIWNVTNLDLSGNKIKNLSKNAFWNLTNVTQIDLRKNQLKNQLTNHSVLSSLHTLRTLLLDDNEIKIFPRYLPPGLQTLSLNSNYIQSIGPENFTGIRNITVLMLNNNNYHNKNGLAISKDTFRLLNLTVLQLSKNNLRKVPSALPSSLQSLSLLLNRIENVRASDLNYLTNLTVLDLSGNCPFCSDTPFQCVSCSTQDKALHIDLDAFDQLSQLQDLRLSGNSLQTIESSWFEKLGKLKYLYLSFNFLVDVLEKGDFFRVLPHVEVVDFSYNNPSQKSSPTLKLSKDFAMLESLQTLHLEGHIFHSLSEEDIKPLVNLRNLSVINFAVNFLEQVNLSVFRNFRANLSLVSLIDNQLTFQSKFQKTILESDELTEDDSNREDPYIHKNEEFGKIPPFIKPECLATGRVLDLSRNNIMHIKPMIFTGGENITCLNLSYNSISTSFKGKEFTNFPHLQYLDLSHNKIYLASESAFEEVKDLQILDLSYNQHYFQLAAVNHSLVFLKNLEFLKVLNLSWNEINTLTNKTLRSNSLQELQFLGNRLDIMWKNQGFERLFQDLHNLTHLDISYNMLHHLPDNISINFPKTLQRLFMRNNGLLSFQWNQLKDLTKLEILDLSKNKIRFVPKAFSKHTKSLQVLDLSHNLIFKLSHTFLEKSKNLLTLNLASNRLKYISGKSFSTASDHHLQVLHLEKNPIQCTCDLLDFILWLEKSETILPHIASDLLCDLPVSKREHPVLNIDFKYACVNRSIAQILYILTTSIICILMIATTATRVFYWDIFYIYNVLRAKVNSYYQKNSDCTYDAFVMYDSNDPLTAEWVLNQLRVELENRGERLRPLCLAERDWTPGMPIMDNLNQSVHRSRKTIFVLTENFVYSGIFKMAAFLAQQRLLEEGVDVMVLVLLEPVLRQSRILNLRRCLCGHSVLEWPKNPAAEKWFWQSLRNAIRIERKLF